MRIVVVGAGVMGASVAYHLAKAGVRKVVVVEKRFLASGATGKSSGLVRMHYDNEPETYQRDILKFLVQPRYI